MNHPYATGPRLARLITSIAGVALAGLLTGCLNDLLKFQAPDRVDSAILEGLSNSQLLVNSAVGDFECAFQQYIVVTGQVADELDNGNLSSAEAFQLDRRAINKERTHYALNGCGSGEGLLMPIQTARYDAEQILAKLEAVTDADVADRPLLMATAAAYAGYSYILLGEGFCSAASSRPRAFCPQHC